MTTRFFNPVQVVMGLGCAHSLQQLVGNRKAALVIFPEADKVGLRGIIETCIGEGLVCVIDNVSPNPDVQELATTYSEFWGKYEDVEVVVAVGGGSVIDTAKSLLVADAERSFDNFISGLKGERPFDIVQKKELIAVPTTAGTGSEVTPWATIWDRLNFKKYSLHLEETWPTFAVIDPLLMTTLPDQVTLHSALDALSHAFESIWNVNSNPVSDALAVDAIHDIIDHLPFLMADRSNVQLRQAISLAALKAGLAFSNTKTALAHSISYEMTLRYGLPHGVACSFPLPLVLERAIGVCPKRDAVIEKALRVPLSDGASFLRCFINSLGVATEFNEYGVSDDQAVELIDYALQGARGKNFIGACT